MELDFRSRELIGVISKEDDAGTLLALLTELNDILQEQHRQRTLGLEGPHSLHEQ